MRDAALELLRGPARSGARGRLAGTDSERSETSSARTHAAAQADAATSSDATSNAHARTHAHTRARARARAFSPGREGCLRVQLVWGWEPCDEVGEVGEGAVGAL